MGLATNDILSHDPLYNVLYCTVFFATSSFRMVGYDASGYKLFIYVTDAAKLLRRAGVYYHCHLAVIYLILILALQIAVSIRRRV